ncbi:hypothetical protein JCM5350_007079 [Sporobolomyces pararoseus]
MCLFYSVLKPGLSQKTFASLALASKQFLPLARSHLYYRPIFNSSGLSWDKALALVSSLSTLGHLVVSLEGIVNFVSRIGKLDDPSTSLPFQLRGFTKTFSLYYKILNSCTNLVSVELIFNSKQHLSKLLKALESSSSDLKSVKFKNSTISPHYRLTTELVCSALNRKELRGIEKLGVEGVKSIDESAPLTAQALRSFSYKQPYGLFSASTILFPINATSLTSFEIELFTIEQQNLDWLFNYLPSTIQHVSIAAVSRNYDDEWMPGIANYEIPIVCSVPLSAISRFTFLQRLSLKGFDGPSLAHLEALATVSPYLTLLDFHNSRWIRPSTSTANPVRNGPSISFLADPDDLLLQLKKFKKLQYVDLGILPTSEREIYQNLEDEMKAKQVEVKWKVCARYPVCPHCGERH